MGDHAGWDPDPRRADDFTKQDLREFELDSGEEVVRLTFTGTLVHETVLKTQGKSGRRKAIE